MSDLIFTCNPPDHKCEWHKVIGFVSQFNDLNGASYSRQSCLDVERPNGNQKEPEVLLKCPNHPDMVIELKTIAWNGSTYFREEANWHLFGDLLLNALSSTFEEGPLRQHVLTIHASSIEGKAKRDITKIADQIITLVKTHLPKNKETVFLEGHRPIPWVLYPHPPYDDSDDRGLVIDSQGESEGLDPFTGAFHGLSKEEKKLQLEGYTLELEKAAKNAADKFSHYSDCMKILLVQFYGRNGYIGTGVNNEDLLKITKEAKMHPTIDQVWVAQYDWDEYDNKILSWLYVR